MSIELSSIRIELLYIDPWTYSLYTWSNATSNATKENNENVTINQSALLFSVFF